MGYLAQQPWNKKIHTGQTRQQLAGLKRTILPDRPPAQGRSTAPRTCILSPTHATGHRGAQHPAQLPARDFMESAHQLQQWAPNASEPWVVATLSHSYKLQFRRLSPIFGWVKMTSISDPTTDSMT